MKTRTKIIVIIGVLAGIIGALFGWRFYLRSQEEIAQSIEEIQEKTGLPVRVYTVEAQDISQTVAISGGIEAWQDVVIAPQVSERIKAFHVATGEKVREGQVLVTLDDTTAKLQLEQAQAQLAQARQNLEKLRNGSRPEEITAAKAQMEQAQAMANLARIEFERQKNLYDNDATTLQNMQRAENEWKSATAAQDAAKATYELVKKGPREEDIRMAEAQVQLAEVAARQVQDHLDKLTLRAPCNGVMTLRQFEIGDLVDFNQVIFRVLDIDRVYLVIDASEIYLPHLKAGLEVRVTADALPEASFTGRVEQIDPGANPADRAFRVKIALNNDSLTLKPGMFARAHIVTKKLNGVFPVPADVVRRDNEGQMYVLAVGDDNVAQRVDVTVDSDATDSQCVITNGVHNSMRLINLAGNTVKAGVRVVIASDEQTQEI
ncbi:MAG: efflux RND transporter periplasmic adaptor subunit [Sedimentisphaerales bacterium]|nr:efflux RND transporter periplasmic adaptor subunit [Sedimentisphaerales bacterium]